VLFANGAGGTGDIEGKVATGSGEQAGDAREFQICGSKTYSNFFRNLDSEISHMNMEGQPPNVSLKVG